MTEQVSTPAGVLRITPAVTQVRDEFLDATGDIVTGEPSATLDGKPITIKRARQILAGLERRRRRDDPAQP